MDYKGPFPLGSGQCHLFSVLDDYSRYLIGLDAMSGPQMEPPERRLIRMFEKYGLPEAMLMDHGAAWWNPTNGHGLIRLSVMLIRQGIRAEVQRRSVKDVLGPFVNDVVGLDSAAKPWLK